MTTLSTQRPFELAWIPPGSAAVNPDQYVEHPEHQLDALRGILYGRNAPGWAGAVIVNQRTAEQGWPEDQCGPYFIDGHARDEVAQQAGAAEIPALIGHWTPAEEKQLIALINHLAMMAVPVPEKQLQLLEDAARLAEDPAVLAALSDLSAAAELAFSAQQTAAAWGSLADDDNGPEVDPNRAEELREKWGTATGQLWLIPSAAIEGKAHRILCGDSLSPDDVGRLLAGVQLRLIATDPPYGVAYDATWRVEAGLSGGDYAAGTINGDDIADWSPIYEVWGLPDILYVWHGGLHADQVALGLRGLGYQIRGQIIWAKTSPVISRGHYHWQHEPCWYAVRKSKTANWQGDRTQTSLWIWGNGAATGRTGDESDDFHAGHISQKPVELFRRPLRNHTLWGDVVGEPFAGSGSQYVAGEQLGRLVYGMDNDPAMVAMVLERLSLMGLRPEMVG